MIYLGADHRGYELKEKLKKWLDGLGYKWEDCGAFEYNKDDDYPDFATAVAEKVVGAIEDAKGNRGILICGSGIGVAISANKVKSVRAGTAASPEQVKASVSDEDLNILALSSDYLSEDAVKDIVKTFLETKFSGEERHVRRLNKIKKIENV